MVTGMDPSTTGAAACVPTTVIGILSLGCDGAARTWVCAHQREQRLIMPLPSDVVARLKSDPTAALAAALIVAGSFPDLVSWAMRAFGGHSPSRDGRSSERPKDGAPGLRVQGVKANAAGRSNGVAKKPAGWIAPLSGKRVARHAADGRVRDEMTSA
jgi:hypothetical protein